MVLAILLGTVLIVGILTTGCSKQELEPDSYTIEDLGLQEIAVEAPDFTAQTLGGGTITLSSLRGTPVLLNFWAIKCPPCVEEMPYLNSAAQQFEGQAAVMTIDIGDNPQRVQEFLENLPGTSQISTIVPLDTQGYVASQYSVGFTPTTFLIDADGIVRYVKVGPFANVAQVVASIELVLPGDVE